MTQRDPLQKYLKKAARFLVCGKETKRRLLDGFYEEITDSNDAFTSEKEIIGVYGTPEEFANALQLGVSEEERKRCLQQKKHRLRRCLLIGILVVVLAVALSVVISSYYYDITPIHYAQDVGNDVAITENLDAVSWETGNSDGAVSNTN